MSGTAVRLAHLLHEKGLEGCPLGDMLILGHYIVRPLSHERPHGDWAIYGADNPIPIAVHSDPEHLITALAAMVSADALLEELPR